MFGTAVHAALKDFFDAGKTRDVGSEFIQKSFLLHLQQQDLPVHVFDEFLERGSRALGGFVAANANHFRTHGKNEFEIGRVLLPNSDELPAVPLTGKIDRIEFLDEAMGRGIVHRVHVVDYKTGKPKSRNEILGETKTSEGNMIRQLLFYKLLLSLYDQGTYNAVSGEINFVEPTENGNYKHESFDLDQKEVAILAKEISRVANEIRTLAFWDKFCDDKDCEYCAVRRMMKGI